MIRSMAGTYITQLLTFTFAYIFQSPSVFVLFFFFQAEAGIRDLYVTGVQTCALPISNFQSGSAQRILARIDIPSHLQWIRRFAPTFDPSSLSPQRLLLPIVREVPGWVARNGATIVGSVAGLALTFAMVLLSAFFFFVEGEAMLDELAILSPLPAEYDHEFGE